MILMILPSVILNVSKACRDELLELNPENSSRSLSLDDIILLGRNLNMVLGYLSSLLCNNSGQKAHEQVPLIMTEFMYADNSAVMG